ncbi:putative ternary complex factor MIP1, leucine-zipper [Medicago truncatula]|uniref:Electron transporter, putative n=1 Tax=Medicago truncatula TaxID=3880 RepID=G7ZYV9_MEDTR|nr:uncharacterized protein LOC25501650 [Medicago truncatula]XP_024629618.1 uncharacterized protein LOC25501650 [Medicago truncatula]KEH20455.1 electron transporter, putative [Medicago truncatula]RHN42166.1 putative ternary complex factor MIP1, leucine-zipper [Medicago truncatula]
MFLGMGLEGLIPRHNRSKSFPDKETVKEDCSDSVEISDQTKLDTGYLTECSATRKKQTPMNNVRQTLKQEILQLEKRLEDQFKVRCTLEKALGYRPISLVNPNDMTIPQPTTELIKDIAVLELEVVYLEQYLLSLYRKAFEQQLSPAVAASASTVEESEKSPPVTTPRARFLQVSPPEVLTKKECSDVQCIDHELHTLQKECNRHKLETPDKEYIVHHPEEKQSDSSVHRCHSSLSQYSTSTAKVSSQEEELTDSLRACYSQPLSMMEYAESIDTSTKVISLAEHLGTRICDHIPETANKLSEDMVKCISAIYYKLADPPMTNPGLSSPSTSISAFSIGDQGDTWSPGLRNNSSFDVQLDNPFNVEGFKEFSGPYSTMVEVPWIYKENQKLADTEQLLQNFRSLICQLEDVDPGKLKHEEKLAFWINVHNALVMHAFLAYGIPQNNVKRVFLLLKAAYNVGGHTVSADTIQNTILGCRMSRPGQWFRVFFSSKTKFKPGDGRQAYAIKHPEPLLHFALCSGNHSDPAVRVYTPKRVFQELEVAKEEYIRATFGIRKDQKMLLPKIVDTFSKDSGLSHAGLIEMIQQSLPESLRKSVKKCHAKSGKSIEWIPHNFTFRYLIPKELVK